jgi:MFS family permease
MLRAVSSIRLTRGSAIHYGWVILAAGTFGSFMTLPGQTAGVSVFFDPITADLGISRTWASIAYPAGTLAGILPAPLIGRWIDRRGPRLTATIIASGLALACAYSLGGWRGAYFVLALLVALTILPVAAVLFRDRPEKFGLTTNAGLPPVVKKTQDEPSFTREEALRAGVFWLLTAVGFLTNAIGTALLLNHFSIMQTAGIARHGALQVLAVYAVVQAAVTLSTGALLDYYEPRHVVPLAMLMLGTASALPAFGSGIAVSWLYALSLGGAYGAQQAIGAAGYAQYFGRDHLGAIRGASFIFGISGAALGPLPFAASVDWTGSYAAVLIGCCVLCVARGAGAFAVRRPSTSAR